MSRFIPNSFQMANAFVDEIMPDLSGNAVKCYNLIVRKTRGWQKESDFISNSQFLTGCKIKSEKTLGKALDELIEVGLIEKVARDGCPNEYS